MREPTLLRIGEFAQIGHVSIATLHHYDEYGLLTPAMLDPQTGYRYYAWAQLARLNRILALKDLGFALEQISQLLDADLSHEQLLTLLRRQQIVVEQALAATAARLRQLTDRLHQLAEEERLPPYDILVKSIDPLLVAAIRARIPHISERRQLQATLAAYLAQQGCQGPFAELLVLHSRHEIADGRMSIDLEVAVPLTTPLVGNAPVATYTLPGSLVAYTVHTGDDLTLGRAYMALQRWIDANGYHITGPVRQIHLQRQPHLDANQIVTEVQMPIATGQL